MNACALWIVTLAYEQEAQQSRVRVKHIMPDLDTRVITVPGEFKRGWFYDSIVYLNWAFSNLPDKIIWLDADTYMVEPVYDMLDALDRFDLLLCHAPGHRTAPTCEPIPDLFPEFNIGVIGMRNNADVRDLWATVQRRQEDHWDVYGNNDQAPLREVLWNGFHVRYCVMPAEYDCRFRFGAHLRDRVRILHGRGDYARVAQQINAGYRDGYQGEGMRVWMPA